jgi:hypothetical protein
MSSEFHIYKENHNLAEDTQRSSNSIFENTNNDNIIESVHETTNEIR